jgi:sugar lactone lactonase YvrE
MRSTSRRGAAAVAALLALAGCSGGGAASSRPLGDAAIESADVTARAGVFRQPIDAAPAPDGGVVYFVASGQNGPGVFSAPPAGGTVSIVTDGAPFVRPSAVAVSTDGSRLYVADQRTGDIDAAGAILSAAATTTVSQLATVLPGTQGRSPRGLDVVRRGTGDVVYFTGSDPATGSPGVFQVPEGGGTVTTVAEGPPFTSLDSVAVTAQGVVYVSDRGAVPGQGQIFRVADGKTTPILTGVHLGSPGGVGLVHGDATLLVSTVDATTSADQLTFVDLATGRTGLATKGIGGNSDTSGGLHPAFNAPVVAWADTAGQVYRIRLK